MWQWTNSLPQPIRGIRAQRNITFHRNVLGWNTLDVGSVNEYDTQLSSRESLACACFWSCTSEHVTLSLTDRDRLHAISQWRGRKFPTYDPTALYHHGYYLDWILSMAFSRSTLQVTFPCTHSNENSPLSPNSQLCDEGITHMVSAWSKISKKRKKETTKSNRQQHGISIVIISAMSPPN